MTSGILTIGKHSIFDLCMILLLSYVSFVKYQIPKLTDKVLIDVVSNFDKKELILSQDSAILFIDTTTEPSCLISVCLAIIFGPQR